MDGRSIPAVSRSFHFAARGSAVAFLTGDHGESLGEHGELAHNYFIYGATQRVPLLLSFPGALPRGEAIDEIQLQRAA